MVEYEVFIIVMPISRQMDTIVESMMFMVTMSMAGTSSSDSPVRRAPPQWPTPCRAASRRVLARARCGRSRLDLRPAAGGGSRDG